MTHALLGDFLDHPLSLDATTCISLIAFFHSDEFSRPPFRLIIFTLSKVSTLRNADFWLSGFYSVSEAQFFQGDCSLIISPCQSQLHLSRWLFPSPHGGIAFMISLLITVFYLSIVSHLVTWGFYVAFVSSSKWQSFSDCSSGVSSCWSHTFRSFRPFAII